MQSVWIWCLVRSYLRILHVLGDIVAPLAGSSQGTDSSFASSKFNVISRCCVWVEIFASFLSQRIANLFIKSTVFVIKLLTSISVFLVGMAPIFDKPSAASYVSLSESMIDVNVCLFYRNYVRINRKMVHEILHNLEEKRLNERIIIQIPGNNSPDIKR